MNHCNYYDKPFNLDSIYEQLNSCQFISDSVEDNSMDQLGIEIVPPLPTNESNSNDNIFQNSPIFKSLSLEVALMTNTEDRCKTINRMLHTMLHLGSRNIVLNTLMSLIKWSFETEDVVIWKLDELGLTNVSKIVQFLRLLLILNTWTEREYKENQMLPNILEKNIFELLSRIIITLADNFQPSYSLTISIIVQVKYNMCNHIFNLLTYYCPYKNTL